MLLGDMTDWLSTGGVGTIGTDLFYGDRVPDSTGDLIMIRVTEGLVPTRTMGNAQGQVAIEHPRIQVEVRSTRYSLGHTTMRSVIGRMDSVKNQLINGVNYHHISTVNSEPIPLGKDESERSRLVMTFQVTKDRST